MFEHVGLARLAEYFEQVHALTAPRGRFVNHAISRPAGHAPAIARRSFVQRYVFPDGELHEVGSVITAMQAAGFEARHMEDLREHYASRCGPGWRTWSRTGTGPSPTLASTGPGCGGCTWPDPRRLRAGPHRDLNEVLGLR